MVASMLRRIQQNKVFTLNSGVAYLSLGYRKKEEKK